MTTQPSTSVPITLTVDGVTYQDRVEARSLLVGYIKERLGLTGVNVGCDTSNCGACTVTMDGTSVKSCTVLTAQADGASVETVRSLAAPDAGVDGWHPLQRAFHDQHGLQCGFCTPGMIMAARDLLERNPDPSEEEVREGLEGNLCRCTGYVNIVRAVQQAAEEMDGHAASSTSDTDQEVPA